MLRQFILIVSCIFFCIPDALVAEIVKLESNFGTINVDGPNYNKQVYLSNNSKQKVITAFPKWVVIDDLFLSPDHKYLAIYYKPDKKPYRLLLYDLENLRSLAEISRGWALSKLFWFNDKILYETDTTGGGRMIAIYDLTLKACGYFNGYELEFNFEAGYAFKIPVYGVENGIFEVYSLDDGKIIDQFDFRKEMGQQYQVKNYDRLSNTRYSFELIGDEDHKYGFFIKEIPSNKLIYKDVQ